MGSLTIRRHEPLAQYTTLGIGGVADYFVIVRSEEDLLEALAYARREDLPITILGGGSNILIDDAGIPGLVIKNDIGGIEYVEEEDYVRVTAGAGVVWDDLVAETVARELWGIENLSGIPGTVGATPIQNVGAYGVEVGDYILHVRVYDQKKHVFTLRTADECAFAYRDSVFKHAEGAHDIVTAVTYTLAPHARPQLTYRDVQNYFSSTQEPTLAEIRHAIIAIRSHKFPDWHACGTAGSFFKNPIIAREDAVQLMQLYPDLPTYDAGNGMVKVSLGWILDKVLHLKGIREGAVGLYKAQALVLINHENATANEVTAFAKHIAQKVFDKTHLRLEWEVTPLPPHSDAKKFNTHKK